MARRVLLAALSVVVLLAGTHRYAVTQERTARDVSLPVRARQAAAARAATLEPFNRRFGVTKTVVDAQVALQSGDIDAAYFELLPYSTSVRGDELFRSTYQAVLAAKRPLDARKAHLQHARETTGGGLAPEDVLK